NQYLGPFVNHEMNRCIQCYRCVRYYREYAGGRDLDVFKIRDLAYFGRQQEGVLENEFAGNLVEICPTGVFTDKTLKQHYTRKWDLQMAPSVCVHCGLGCNTTAGERYDSLRRIVNRYNGEVNGYFLCDRGRFGYEHVNSKDRIRRPMLRKDGQLQPVAKQEALTYLRSTLAAAKIAGIGSPRASLEANFALRALVGAERFYAGVAEAEYRLTALIAELLKTGPARTLSLRELENADAALILGEDVTNVAPLMALSLRQSARQAGFRLAKKLGIPAWLDHPVREAAQDLKSPLFVAATHATHLDDVAAETYRAAPAEIARLGFAVAHAIDANAPDAPNLPEDVRTLANRIAEALKSAERPVVVSGSSLNSEEVVQAAANVAWALCRAGKPAGLSFTLPECNSLGLGLMGARPLGEMIKAVKSGEADTVVILENDLYRRAPRAEVDALLDEARHVIVLDVLSNSTTAKAGLLLPAGSFAECEGTLVSSEGRAQRFFSVYPPQGDVQQSWRWLRDAMLEAGRREAEAWRDLDDVIASLAKAIPPLSAISKAAPSASFRLSGSKVPREPHRYSGRTAILADINVSEPKPPEDQDSALSYTMEGYPDQAPAALTPFFWSPGWNSIQSVNKFQEEIGGPLRAGDAGVRLIEPGLDGLSGQAGGYRGSPPETAMPGGEERLLAPLYHIFGSDELSRRAPAVAELAPKPYVALNAEDASQLGVVEGQEVAVQWNGSAHRLPVKLRPDLPAGVAGLPVGLPGTEGAPLPARGKISQG
ncbi:MAG: molybdopterin-dependent oxidoreductase, partial [Terriglobia bacterium]